MSAMSRGPHPNLKRRLQMAELRAKGLTYRQIGERLGVTRQCVHGLLRKTDPDGLTYIACCICRRKITRWRGTRPAHVFCVKCLPSDAPFGQRLRTYRVAASLTTMALAAQAGIAIGSIFAYERGAQQPDQQNRAKLVQVLGVELPSQPKQALPRHVSGRSADRRRHVAELRAKSTARIRTTSSSG
jgi:transcriptional regulator with XRE-family HTH domain